jgi:hypothetical protein
MFDVSRRLDAGRGPTISAGDGIFAVPGSPRPSLPSSPSKGGMDGLGAVPSVLEKYQMTPPSPPSDGTVENTELGGYIIPNNRSGQVLLQILNLKVSEVSA